MKRVGIIETKACIFELDVNVAKKTWKCSCICKLSIFYIEKCVRDRERDMYTRYDSVRQGKNDFEIKIALYR